MTEQTEAPARPLYDRLRRIQLDNGWTNVQLAEKADISRGTIDNWKTQPRSPLAATVKAVAERLGIPYPEALELAGIDVAPASGRGQAGRIDVAWSDDGAVELTVIVNPDEPEPEHPPGGLRDQVERIIWAIDEPWHIRWAQIKARRALLAPEVPSEAERHTERGS